MINRRSVEAEYKAELRIRGAENLGQSHIFKMGRLRNPIFLQVIANKDAFL